MKISTGTGLFIIFAFILIFGALLSPVAGPSRDPSKKASAKNDVVQLATAITAYEVEYGRLPGTNRSVVGKELMDTLTGRNATLNPHNIVFFEPRIAKNGKGGLTPEGTYLDPWGGAYQVAFDTDWDGIIPNAGMTGAEVHKKVAVWNTNSAPKLRITSWD